MDVVRGVARVMRWLGYVMPIAMLFPLMMSLPMLAVTGSFAVLLAWSANAQGARHADPERRLVAHVLLLAACMYTPLLPLAGGLLGLAVLVIFLPPRARLPLLLPGVMAFGALYVLAPEGHAARDPLRSLQVVWPLAVHMALVLALVLAFACCSPQAWSRRRRPDEAT